MLMTADFLELSDQHYIELVGKTVAITVTEREPADTDNPNTIYAGGVLRILQFVPAQSAGLIVLDGDGGDVRWDTDMYKVTVAWQTPDPDES